MRYSFFTFFQQDRIIPADPITGSERIKTLKRLDQVIQQRLVTSKLPPQMSNLVIGKDTVNDRTVLSVGKVIKRSWLQ